MDESQEVYSTKQLADSLKLGSAMVRKYAVALEKLTGEDIPLKRRDGRQFSREHFSIIASAKSLVDAHNGLSVDTALQMVAGKPENSAEALAAPKTSGNTQELTEALTAAIAKGNEPLLAELRELRQEFKRREQPVLGQQKREPVEQEHGLLVRLALWVERRLG
jgi:hypothetical protein